ncbi:MAG: stage II sporulation protein R [Clostridia bacterium]|nr:stage II sporulation protein R [Clostridia bacterium]
MKKIFVGIICLALVGIVAFFGTPAQTQNEYLRIHIRANSNAAVDQAVKYQVKDAVVDFMIPLLAKCETKAESIQTVENNLSAIERVAETVLLQNGFSYCASALLNKEKFPTRSYGDLTLESGFYDALILNLGTGTGDNWWCVVYPPLCFVNGGATTNIFKSRILEIINSII